MTINPKVDSVARQIIELIGDSSVPAKDKLALLAFLNEMMPVVSIILILAAKAEEAKAETGPSDDSGTRVNDLLLKLAERQTVIATD